MLYKYVNNDARLDSDILLGSMRPSLVFSAAQL
jgi:hypothetical protein